MTTLEGVANDNDDILDNPAPRARFRRFGDSSLDFVLLFWIDQPETRFPIQDAVNRGIVREFAKAGIEIPFPKRDVTILDGGGPAG